METSDASSARGIRPRCRFTSTRRHRPRAQLGYLESAAAGIPTNDRGFIQVNDRLETTAAGVYALGDIKGGPAFTHISYDDFRIIRANLIEEKTASITNRLVPYTSLLIRNSAASA